MCPSPELGCSSTNLADLDRHILLKWTHDSQETLGPCSLFALGQKLTDKTDTYSVIFGLFGYRLSHT